MTYKHKFILTTKQGEKMELATCGDTMTALVIVLLIIAIHCIATAEEF